MAFSSSGSASASASSSWSSSSRSDPTSLVGVCALDDVAVAFRTDDCRGLMTILGTEEVISSDISLATMEVRNTIETHNHKSCSMTRQNFRLNSSFSTSKEFTAGILETQDKYKGLEISRIF
jgi:hypothetical protein